MRRWPGPLTVLRLVAAVVALSRIARARRRTPPVSDAGAETPGVMISVVVPARDEASRITPLLLALRGAPGVHEVIVVDDCSTDATAAIARDLGARVVTGTPPPSGWAGKAWALQQGIEAASGTWVVTLDADTRPAPTLPVAAVTRARADGLALLTLAGRFECPTPGLQVLHPAMLTTLVYRVGPVDSDPPPRRVMANGQCMVFDRDDMLRRGGLAPVAGEVVEDVALARSIVAAGARVAMADASALLTVRMYEDVVDAWTNWGRSLALGGVDRPIRQVADLGVLVVAQALPLVRLAVGRADLLDAVLLVARAGTLVGTAGAYENRRPAYWASPLADAAAVGNVAVGIARGLRRTPRLWRGRTYA